MTSTEPSQPVQPSPYGQQAPYAQAAAEPRGLSITSMICGIAGIVFPFFLPSVAAVVFGHIARKKEPTASALSLTGLITGYIGIGLSVLVVGLIVVFAVIVPLIIISTTAGTIESFGTIEPGFAS